jgi:hypothetical protein
MLEKQGKYLSFTVSVSLEKAFFSLLSIITTMWPRPMHVKPRIPQTVKRK